MKHCIIGLVYYPVYLHKPYDIIIYFRLKLLINKTLFPSFNASVIESRAVDEPATTARFGRNERSI